MNARTLKFIREIIKFLLKVYQKYWFTSTSAILAPYNDLSLLQDIVDFAEINPEISKVTFSSFSHHLWYLNETKIGLAFFDKRISLDEKRRMVVALEYESRSEEERITIERSEVKDKKIHHFVTKRTLKFFQDFEINTSWLQRDPEFWENDNEYKAAISLLEKLSVVNDSAERGIKLMQSLNKSSKDEGEIQNRIQVVEENRRLYTDHKKETLLSRKIPQSGNMIARNGQLRSLKFFTLFSTSFSILSSFKFFHN